MKAMVCELCGSNEIVKDGDYFVCQSCGTKYTTEAARKLLLEFEKPVEVTGTVIVENNTTVEKLFERAKGFANEEKTDTAKKYIEQALDLEPQNGTLLKAKGLIDEYNSLFTPLTTMVEPPKSEMFFNVLVVIGAITIWAWLGTAVGIFFGIVAVYWVWKDISARQKYEQEYEENEKLTIKNNKRKEEIKRELAELSL